MIGFQYNQVACGLNEGFISVLVLDKKSCHPVCNSMYMCVARRGASRSVGCMGLIYVLCGIKHIMLESRSKLGGNKRQTQDNLCLTFKEET